MTPLDLKTPAGESLSDARAQCPHCKGQGGTMHGYTDAGTREEWDKCVQCDGTGFATPPATDAAASGARFVLVPARTREEWRDWMQADERCISRDTAYRGDRLAHMLAVLDQIGAISAAAPKAASEAGAGRVTARMIVAAKRYVRGENDAIRWAIEAALSTDATDGATVASDAAGLRQLTTSEVQSVACPLPQCWGMYGHACTDGRLGNLETPHSERIAVARGRLADAAALAASPSESATRADHAQGGGEPFAYFQRNEGWGIWEEVGPDHKGDDPSIVAAYRHPPTTPGADLLEQADIVDVVLPIIVRNTPSVGRSAHHVACEVADAVLRALSPARDGAGS